VAPPNDWLRLPIEEIKCKWERKMSAGARDFCPQRHHLEVVHSGEPSFLCASLGSILSLEIHEIMR